MPDQALWGETVTPVYHTTAFSQRSAQDLADLFQGRLPGYNYSRIANPTCTNLEQNLAALDDGLGCIATASEMAAIAAVAIGLLRSGDHLIAANGIFGGTISLFVETLAWMGIRTELVDASDTQNVERTITPRTRMIFVETIGNPRLDVPDIPALAALARKAGIPLVVDNTVMTSALFKPKSLGADIVVYSASKFICGFGTAIGGAIIDTGLFDWSAGPFEQLHKSPERNGPYAFLAYMRNVVCRNLGSCLAPWNCFLINQGLQTLSMRMARHVENASYLAEYLAVHKAVKRVRYPGLPGDRFYERTRRLFGGKAGAILCIHLADRQKAFEFLDGLKLIKQAPNIGDSKTLAIHPAPTILWQFDKDQRIKMGVTDDMVRISVGLEPFEQICEDVEQALSRLAR
jgi:O-acetylhomoserine (thiol)-lyase